MEICVENLPDNRVEKLTPKMVRRLLGIDNKEIAELCRQISLIPKKDARGQTYFSREDVDVLQKIRQLHTQARVQECQSNIINYSSHIQPQIQPLPVDFAVNAQAPVVAPDFEGLENKLVDKISQVIDEKLEGMDEVVVELIRCKTENETLRQKINSLNKEVYALKNELATYQHVGLNFYMKR